VSHALAPVRHRSFRMLWAGRTVSMLGNAAALASPGWGLAVDATAFAAASLCFARITATPEPGAARTKPAMLSGLHQGWTEFTARTWVWLIVVAFCFINAAFAASNQVLGPVIADHSIGRRAWGLILACQTIGMLIGAAAGPIAAAIGITRTLLAAAAIMASATTIMIVNSSIRGLRSPAPDPQPQLTGTLASGTNPGSQIPGNTTAPIPAR
jgi:hypothetical protein